ncbi:peptide ligase PGM1-related protein [Streptomyces orinoci]|uniref:Peptide ligase PGM1-related protein n=1 Tax=Streptomyces orinoci TaxID=67339 RepID=A0ABV3K3N0_STRON|nr:peptide ligase PGM1-related protein [Streptomyces orinoci]
MTTLLIGNTRTREMVGDPAVPSPAERRAAACAAHRLLWWARDGDVLVLPTAPGEDFTEYVTARTGTRRATLTMLVPPPGRHGAGILSPDRLAGPGFRAALHRTLAGRVVRRVLPVCAEPAVARLAQDLGCAAALPGHAFHAQGGAALVNSKAAFRAIAAGTGIPLAPGTVANTEAEAVAAVTALLGEGHCAMLKREFAAGGQGNLIVAPRPGIRPLGASEVLVLPTGPDIEALLGERWPVLSNGHRNRLVVERYHPESTAVYAEFDIGSKAISLLGTGEMLMDPTVTGEITPALVLTPPQHRQLVADARRLCAVYQAMGYRGNISPDAIRTPAGELLFTEANGRLTGSTHLHTVIGTRLLGRGAHGRRVLAEDGGLPAPSFRAARDRLTAAGLDFDPATGTGTLLTGDHTPANGTVTHCVIAEDPDTARDIQRTLAALATGVRT